MILDLDCVDIYEQCNGMGHFIEKIKPYRKSGFLIRYGVASLFGGHAVTHNDIAKNPIIRYILFENAIPCEPIAIL